MATVQTIISGTADAPVRDGTAEYSTLMGDGDTVWHATEANRESIISTPGKLTNLKVSVKTAPSAGKSWTFTIRLGNAGGAMADTALSVTISDTDVLSSLDTSEVTVAAGQRVDISATGAGTPTAAGAIYWRCDFIPDTAGETLLLSNTAGNESIDDYNTLIGSKWPDITEFDGQTLFPTAGTLKNLYVELTAAPGAGKSRTYTIWKNGIAQSLVVTISDSATTGSDTDPAHAVTIAAGDKVAIKESCVGVPEVLYVKFGSTFLPDTAGEWITSATTDDATSSSAVEYQHLNCGDSTLTATENEQHGLAPATTAKKIYVNLSTAPGAGYTWVFTLREALADTALTVSIADANTSGNAAIDEAIAADALVNTSIDAMAGTATSKTQIAILFYNAPTVPAAPAFKLKMIPKRPWNRMSRLYKSLSLKGG